MVGLVCGLSPSYVSDIASPEARGPLGTFFQILVCVGQLYLFTLSNWFHWDALCFFGIAPMVLLVVGMFVAPEAPIRLIQLNKIDEARSALKRLRNAHSDIESELESLQSQVEQSKSLQSGFGVLTRVDVYKPLGIAVMLMFFQQFSGINAVMFYMSKIFEASKDLIEPKVATVIVNLALVLATLASGLVIDRFGRKVLLYVSGAGMAVMLALMGLNYVLALKNTSWLPVVILIGFVIFFSFGYGPIPWMIVGELTPNEAKGLITAIGCATNWLFAFIITNQFESLQTVIHNYGAYWFFSAVSVSSVIYTFFIVPETKMRSIEDMQRYFKGDKGTPGACSPHA